MEFQAQAPVCKSWEGGRGWSFRVSGGEQEAGSQQRLGFANQLNKLAVPVRGKFQLFMNKSAQKCSNGLL